MKDLVNDISPAYAVNHSLANLIFKLLSSYAEFNVSLLHLMLAMHGRIEDDNEID